MRVIHVLRKPISEGTISANTLKHGVGGLNIDASRVGTHGEVLSCSIADPYHAKDGTQRTWNPTTTRGVEMSQHSAGRWPANVILQHLDGCLCDGVFSAGKGGVVRASTADEDGKETVANWICEPGCPVARLDEQSGGCPSTGNHPSMVKNTSIYRPGQPPMAQDKLYADTGGASRFFKQVGGK